MNFIRERIDEVCNLLKKNMYETVYTIEDIVFAECDYKENYKNENVPDESLIWKPFEKDMRFGRADKHFWFRFKIKTPKKSDGKKCVFSLITAKNGEGEALNPQGLLYLDGKIVQGTDVNHTEAVIDFDREYDALLYMYSGMYDQLFDFEPSVRIIDERIKKLYYDLSVPADALKYIDPDSENYKDSIRILNDAVNILDLINLKSEEFFNSVDEAIDFLDGNFYNGICGKTDLTVNCIGHTHIDVAWLWTVAQTREKAQRSFATVLKLMEEYPEYKFMSSQPQLYAYVKKSAPEVYEKIKKAVAEKRWEVEGAMWLEADCNLISGESLVRQILFGKRFMKEEFGVDSKVLWLPDVFGYNAAMPQILKKCGVDKFFTSKISWNDTNKMPYDVFMWQGIDGSEIFTSFLTAREVKQFGENDSDDRYTAYSGFIRPAQILGTWKRFSQKEYSKETLVTFGYGDGGGGPSRDMLEQQRRLAYGLPGFPKTKINFAGDYLEKLKSDFEVNSEKLKNMPRWLGELYLELHRGTYTSIAKNKKNNRRSEVEYRSTELLSVINMLLLNEKYPEEKLKEGWQEILLNQFHDIIPGSSIHEVYEDSDRSYRHIFEISDAVKNTMLENIRSNVKTDGGVLVFNPNGFEVSSVVNVDGKTVYAENIPPLGYKVVKECSYTNTIAVTESCIENEYFRIGLENGNIFSIYDKKNNREIIKNGEYANEFRIYEDIPRAFDAWEISDYYTQKMWTADEVASIEKICDGVRAGIRVVRNFRNSRIEQNIWLYENIDRIDFETTADWNEEHLLLKTVFPLDINVSEATYDIQFGSVKRPTHKNTSWDAARFEVCGHKWADISDSGYGVSLMNDCKYGYSAEGSVLTLSLIKCATYPNPEADKGKHSFTYSLYSHAGTVYDGNTIKSAYELNQPLIAEKVSKTDGVLPEEFAAVSTSSDNIIIETVKKAEASEDIIIRMYEASNKRTETKITLGFDFEKAYICDLTENELAELEKDGRSLILTAKNFEIITLKIKR